MASTPIVHCNIYNFFPLFLFLKYGVKLSVVVLVVFKGTSWWICLQLWLIYKTIQ